MDTDNQPKWEDDQPPIYTPNAPISGNNAANNIAYDASGKADFATIDVPDDDNNNNGDQLEIGGDDDDNDNNNSSAVVSNVPNVSNAPIVDNPASGGEVYKKSSGVNVYNGAVNVGEGVNGGQGHNGPKYKKLPPWFESTGNETVDYALARSRFCCCSLRAGIETMAIGVILVSIWDLLISSQFAEEALEVTLLSLFRILGGLCGFYGAWKYHKNASRIFFIFWCIDLIIVFILLLYSIWLINNCNDDYDDDSGDWYWWYNKCRYKFENLTGLYLVMFMVEVYCVIMSRRFFKLMADI